MADGNITTPRSDDFVTGIACRWLHALAQARLSWAEDDLASEYGRLNADVRAPSDALKTMEESLKSLKVYEPSTVRGCRAVLDVATQLLIDDYLKFEQELDYGAVVALMRNVSRALNWAEMDVRLGAPDDAAAA